jgi:hypothetical protein
MSNCSGLFSGQDVDCQNPLAVGVVQELYLANRNDIESFTYSILPEEENIITAIIMKTGKLFYKFGGVNESINAQNELVRRSVSNGYKHSVNVAVFEVDNVSLQNMQAMAYQPQVAIVLGVNDSSLGNGGITVYGVEAGMDVITNVRILSDVDTGASHQIAMATPDTGGDEKIIPPPFFVTDYNTTLDAVIALTVPPV